MVNVPAGTTTISGHLSHSLKLSFGFNARSSAADSGAAYRDASETVFAPPPHGPGAAGGTTGGTTTAGTTGVGRGGTAGDTGGAAAAV